MNTKDSKLNTLLHRILYHAKKSNNKLIWKLVQRARQRVILDFSEYLTPPATGRALVSFVVSPLLLPSTQRDRITNQYLAMETIARSLNKMGYTVDIVNWDNPSWTPTKHYDLFIGLGDINFKHISDHLSADTTRIYYATGAPWRENNIREAERFFRLAQRTGYLLPPDRANPNNEDDAYRLADGIICLGNQRAANAFSMYPLVCNIDFLAAPSDWEGWQSKDYDQGRKHFLFFSGRGNVHKGLDLLLEAFAKTGDLHLHICQHPEPDFYRVYRTYLTSLPNIHVHGFTKMRSPEFEELARSCDWVIMPTCAEGQPGSTLECMAHGLIPILSIAANMDLENWGIRLPDCEVDTIRTIVEEISQMPVEEVQQRTARVVANTRQHYSVEMYETRFAQAVSQIVARKRGHAASSK